MLCLGNAESKCFSRARVFRGGLLANRMLLRIVRELSVQTGGLAVSSSRAPDSKLSYDLRSEVNRKLFHEHERNWSVSRYNKLLRFRRKIATSYQGDRRRPTHGRSGRVPRRCVDV